MDVQFQKSIFGILVPNGPYSKVLPWFLTEVNVVFTSTNLLEMYL